MLAKPSGHDERQAASTARSRPIETDATPDVMAKLLNRVSRQWMRLGETEPHWSVLTDNAWRSDRIGRNSDYFYATGKEPAHLLEVYEQRAGSRLPRNSCMEIGCGVGRITTHLARIFETVIGVDVSPGNLAVARERAAQEGLANIDFRLIKSVNDFDGLPTTDVLISFIALQHNSPPIQREILSRVLPRIRSGCLFQAVTNWPEYTFNIANYLASDDVPMELHALPQHVIFDLLAREGFAVREVVSDAWVCHYGSNTFFAVRS